MRNPLTRLFKRATSAEKIERTRPPAPRTRASRAGDRALLGVAVLVTAAVSGAVGWISFRHFVDLAITLGERPSEAFLYPAAAEGMVIMAGLVKLYCSRRGLRVPLLAWTALVFGVAVALVVNVAHGWANGQGAAALGALAPLAFLASYELLMRLIRLVRQAAMRATEPAPEAAEPHVCPAPEAVKVPVTIRRVVEKPVETVVEKPVEVERIVEKPVPVTVETRVEVPTPIVPVDALDAARIAYEHSLNGPGRPLGQRTLARRFGIEHRAAEEIIKASQEPADEPPAEDPEAAPAVTDSDPAEETAQDRHSTPADETPDTSDAALIAWFRATPADARQEAADDRHSTAPEKAADERAATAENAPRPAAVTISAAPEAPANDRHSTPPEEAAEEARETTADEPSVTVPEPPVEAPAVPSQRTAPQALTILFQAPPDEPSVTVPEEPARPSHDDGMSALDRAIAQAIADRHRLPALNGHDR
ncbi:DUF2637 domain-containing protein [Nonomuraea sp. NPDC050404]|uniref:DUF2637 domain-containing protein n=1 Tax=Nonomuraea sp. NPDC050404 TaxID=3155783 RepID=UPI0033E271A7